MKPTIEPINLYNFAHRIQLVTSHAEYELQTLKMTLKLENCDFGHPVATAQNAFKVWKLIWEEI